MTDQPVVIGRLVGMMDTPDLARAVVAAREVHVRLFAGAEERLKESATRDDPMEIAERLDGETAMSRQGIEEQGCWCSSCRAERRVCRAIADEVEDALGDTELLPAGVRAAFDDLLHRLRTGRER